MEPAVPVEQHEPEVPVTSGPGPPAAAVEVGIATAAAGTAEVAGTAAAGTAGSAGGEDGCCCRKLHCRHGLVIQPWDPGPSWRMPQRFIEEFEDAQERPPPWPPP